MPFEVLEVLPDQPQTQGFDILEVLPDEPSRGFEVLEVLDKEPTPAQRTDSPQSFELKPPPPATTIGDSIAAIPAIPLGTAGAVQGINANIDSGEGPTAFETLMEPVVNIAPWIARGVINAGIDVAKAVLPIPPSISKPVADIVSPKAREEILQGTSEFAAETASALTSPGMVALTALGIVAPPAAAAIIAAMGAQSIGPSAVEAIEASKRGDLRGFVKAAEQTALAGVMTGGGGRAVRAAIAEQIAPLSTKAFRETGRAQIKDEPTLEVGQAKTALPAMEVPTPEATPGASVDVQAAPPSRPGALLTPTPPVPTVEPKAIRQIITDLSEGLGLPIRFGRLIKRAVGGYFNPKADLIGVKKADDIVVTSHEVGHKVDSITGLSADPALDAELMHLGDNTRAGSMSSWTPSKTLKYRRGEGMGEFLRYWLTDPAEATRLAPTMEPAFETAIANHPDINKVLRQARDDIALWRSSEPQARLRSQISVGEEVNKARYTLSDLTRDMVDDLHYLRLAADDSNKLGGLDLKPTENPYVMARLLRGAYGVADTFIKSGVIDYTTREVSGPGLKQILEPVGPRIADFRDYIVARQAREMRAQGKETGLVPDDVDFVAKKFSGDAEFNTAFDALKQWSDSFIKYSVDAGYLSVDAATAMRKMNQEYVPLHRVFEVGAGESGVEGASGRGLNQVKQAFKGRHGSTRQIVDPLETYVKNAYSILLNADKNAVNIAIAGLSQRPGMGKWVERIATPKEFQKVGLDKIREQLEDSGADLAGVPDDLLLTFFRDSNRAPTGENIIKVNRGGKQEFYRLDRDLYKTVQAMDMESAASWLKIVSAPAQILRAGATLTPDFAISNAMRDTVSSSVISRYGVFPVESTIKGVYALLKNPKIVNEWKASGGGQSVEAHYFDRAALQDFLKKNISKDFSFGDYAKFVAKSPLTALRLLSGTLEEATRVGEFSRVYDKLIKQGYDIGEARRLAAFEARDLQDFAMGGAQTKSLRRVTAFWNAALQGNYRLYQSLKDPKTRAATVAKGVAWVTVPTVTLFAINKDDPDYWDLPQWRRDVFWLIPRGKDTTGHTKFLHIPKPFEIGLIFGTVPERAMQFWFNQDPEAFKDLGKQAANQSIPNPIPQTVMSVFGAFLSGDRGYDAFRGRAIVPESMKDFPPELQMTEQTSLTAKRIGKTLGFAPLKVDYLINQLGGGLARQGVNQGLDRVLSWVTGEERTARETYPGARFVGLPSGVSSAAVENFYDRLKTLRQEGERRKLTGAGEDRFLTLAENTARRLSVLRKSQLKIKDETERQKISLEMRTLAERTLELMKTPN